MVAGAVVRSSGTSNGHMGGRSSGRVGGQSGGRVVGRSVGPVAVGRSVERSFIQTVERAGGVGCSGGIVRTLVRADDRSIDRAGGYRRSDC